MSVKLARRIDAIPVVDDNTDRTAKFASPTLNQRVQNLTTGAIERWNGSAWVLVFPNVVTLANDATPTVLNVVLAKTGGTTTITDFDDGVVGQPLELRFDHATTITDGSNILLNASANFVGAAGDVMKFRMFTDQVWEEVSRKVN